jgi:hypothetical protein
MIVTFVPTACGETNKHVTAIEKGSEVKLVNKLWIRRFFVSGTIERYANDIVTVLDPYSACRSARVVGPNIDAATLNQFGDDTIGIDITNVNVVLSIVVNICVFV